MNVNIVNIFHSVTATTTVTDNINDGFSLAMVWQRADTAGGS